MATIALYANKVNLMPELLKGMKQSVNVFGPQNILTYIRNNEILKAFDNIH